MASPFTWDTSKPAGADALNIGDDQIRTDKITVRDVLRTLVPYGTPTTGWRVVQENNDIYIVHNAKYDGTNWSHDDTTLDAIGLRFTGGALGVVDVIFRDAAASTWLSGAWLTRAKFDTNSVNFYKDVSFLIGAPARAGTSDNFDFILRRNNVDRVTIGDNKLDVIAPTGQEADIRATGVDADIDVRLEPKGLGISKGIFFATAYVLKHSLEHVITQVAVDNTIAETSVYSFSVTGNMLGTTRGILMTLWGEAGNNNVAVTITLRMKFGATTLITQAVTYNNTGTAGSLQPLMWQVLLRNEGVTNSQKARSWFDLPNNIGSPAQRFAANGTAVEDSTTAKTFDVTVQWGIANANNRFRREAIMLELI